MLGGDAYLMPGIPMKLIDQQGNMRPRTVGLVDSGCDFSNFPAEWAEPLGISLDDCLAVQGSTAGGPAAKYLFERGIHATILGHKVPLGAFFSPGLPIALLGREDFFRCFKVSLDQASQTFQVEAEPDWDAATAAVSTAIRDLARRVRARLMLGIA